MRPPRCLLNRARFATLSAANKVVSSIAQTSSPRQRTGPGVGLVKLGLEIHARLAQALEQVPVPRVAVPLHDAARDDLADILALGQLVHASGEEVIGAVGASGAPGGEKDEACVKAGIDKVADQLK